MKKVVIDNDLGIINLTKNSRSKKIIIRIKNDCVAVTLPERSTYEEALKFVETKRDWILTHKNNIKTSRKNISNEEPFQTFTFCVKLQSADRKNYFISLKNNLLTIEYPEKTNPESENAQKVFRKAIENGLRHEAKRVLPEMLGNLAKQHGFSFVEVKINSSKSRWGSCSSKGSINLSFYMMLLPEHLIKYVLLHELCHTKEMNHGAKFWQLLNSISDNKAKQLSNETKKYSKITSRFY